MGNKPGPKPKFVITDEMLEKVESLASRGLTQEQIANSLGFRGRTLEKYKAKSTVLVDAIKRGQAKGISVIANALFEGARRGNVTSQIFYLKVNAKWRENNIINNINNDDVIDKLKLSEDEYKKEY